MKRLKSEEIYTITSSLAVLLEAGIPLQEGFAILMEEAQGSYQVVLSNLHRAMEEGSSLYEAMKQEDVFPTYALEMTQVGETTGCLDQVMNALSKYYEREINMKEQLKTAVTYPLMLLIMMFVVVAVLVFKVLPIFQNVLQSLGSGLSSNALTFMQIGKILAQAGFVALFAFFVFIAVLYTTQRKKSKNDSMTYVISHLFLTKKLYYELSIAQITYVFSLFLSSGVDVIQAFSHLAHLDVHPRLSKALSDGLASIEQGNHFAQAMRSSKLYEGMEASMLEVGYRSGKQDQVMRQLADRYEQKVEQSIVAFLNVMEPTIVAILSLLVGMVLLSVMLPLMGIMSSAG